MPITHVAIFRLFHISKKRHCKERGDEEERACKQGTRDLERYASFISE